MTPVKVGEIHIVPEWFGLKPSEARDVIAQMLERAGSRQAGDTFTLNVRAITNLRREGVTIRNQQRVRSARRAALGNRAHVEAVRSWVAMTRAHVSGHEARLACGRLSFRLAPVVHSRPHTIPGTATTAI